jgi:hypothetical protein
MRNRRSRSVTRGGARVRVPLAGFRQEPPVVGGCTERELEHAIGCVLVRLAVAVERLPSPVKNAPPVPTMNCRTPWALSRWVPSSCGAKRS